MENETAGRRNQFSRPVSCSSGPLLRSLTGIRNYIAAETRNGAELEVTTEISGAMRGPPALGTHRRHLDTRCGYHGRADTSTRRFSRIWK